MTLDHDDQPTALQKKGMRAATLAQAFGTLAQLAFTNGQLLVVLSVLGISSSRLVLYLALPSIIDLLAIPIAYLADRWGKKKIGLPGMMLTTVGFGTLALSFFFSHPFAEIVAL